MDRSVFQAILILIKAAALEVEDALYENGVTDHWCIAVNTTPRRRVVWDGKERRFYVQQETARMLGGKTEWDDIAVASAPEHLSAEWAIGRLRGR